LFEATVLRAASLPNVTQITIVCNENHRFMAAQQAAQALASIGSSIKVHTLLEPVARNTAPAIAAVAHSLPADAIMVVLPSDHHMTHVTAFHSALNSAVHAVQLGHLCTFGIVPSAPETGYGYIEAGEPITATQAHLVKRFVEKPGLTKALALLATGTHTWNSGMFVMQAADFLTELARYAPAVHTATQAAVQHASVETDFTRLHKASFEQAPSISVDYAVFEHTSKAAVIAYHGDWSDLGSWAAVADLALLHPTASDSPQISIASNNNHIQANKPVALVGVDDLVIVDTPDALLITRKSARQRRRRRNVPSQTHPCLPHRQLKLTKPRPPCRALDGGAGLRYNRHRQRFSQRRRARLHPRAARVHPIGAHSPPDQPHN
jgi:mannose-1-phosphate guanylyltransferase / mannose-6-phosphate isomerase